MPSTISGCYAEIRKYEALSSSISSLVSLLNSNEKNFDDSCRILVLSVCLFSSCNL